MSGSRSSSATRAPRLRPGFAAIVSNLWRSPARSHTALACLLVDRNSETFRVFQVASIDLLRSASLIRREIHGMPAHTPSVQPETRRDRCLPSDRTESSISSPETQGNDWYHCRAICSASRCWWGNERLPSRSPPIMNEFRKVVLIRVSSHSYTSRRASRILIETGQHVDQTTGVIIQSHLDLSRTVGAGDELRPFARVR